MSFQLPFGIRVLNPLPVENKYFNSAGTPYTGTSQVLSQVTAGIRHIGLTVNVNNVEYWFATGTTNGDLVIKTAAAAAGSLTGATNGLSLTGGGTKVGLGGSLTGNTTINATGRNVTIQNAGSFQVTATGFTSISSPNGFVQIGSDSGSTQLFGGTAATIYGNAFNSCVDVSQNVAVNASSDILLYANGSSGTSKIEMLAPEIIVDSNEPLFAGIKYDDDYSTNFTPRSLVDKEYVDLAISGATPATITANNGLTKSGNNIYLGGTLTGTTTIDANNNQFVITNANGINLLDQNGGQILLESNGGGVALSDDGGGIYLTECGGGGIYIGDGTSDDGGIFIEGRTGIFLNAHNQAGDTQLFKLELAYDRGALFTDFRTGSTAIGIEYDADYSANYTARSLVDKAYVDAVAQGLDPKESVRVATTTALTGATYVASGGTTGTGQFTSAPTTIDGIALANGNRILVKNQADPKQNGIYVRISTTVWNRAADQDGTPAAEVSSGNFTFVETGSTLAATGWVVGGDGILVVNTNPINWIQFSAANSYLAGDGIEIVGNTISVDLATNSGLDFNGGDLRVAPTIAGAGLDLTAGVLSVIVNNGLTVVGDNVVLGGPLTGNTYINTNGNGIVIGCNSTASAANSFAQGLLTCAAGSGSHAEGRQTCAIGGFSHAEGGFSHACGSYSHAEGASTRACGCAHAEGFQTCALNVGAHSEGRQTIASGEASHAEGYNTNATGASSHAGGCGYYSVIAGGVASFNHSINTYSQIEGHGALASGSTILGGSNHNIASGNIGAAIIGGSSIKLTGTTYINTVAVANLAIMTAPSAGVTGDTVLVRDAVTGKIRSVSQASISAGAADTTANNGLTKSGQNIHLGGTLTGHTAISGLSSSFKIQTNKSLLDLNETSQMFVMSGETIQMSGEDIILNSGFDPISGQQYDNGNISLYQKSCGGEILLEQGSGFVGDTVQFRVSTGSTRFDDSRTVTKGIEYGNDYSAGFNDRSLVDKGFVLNTIAVSAVTANNGLTKIGNTVVLGGSLTGNTTITTNAFGLAFGYNAVATGQRSLAVGSGVVASAGSSQAFGENSIASGITSHAQGFNTCAIGQSSHAEGFTTCAYGTNSHAEGSYTIASGTSSHAEGYFSCALGNFSHSEGVFSYAIGDCSHAEGANTRACGNASHAEGNASDAFGLGSHAEGSSCAVGTYSHSQGFNTIASGHSSHSGGYGGGALFVLAGGFASFNHSVNTTTQTAGYGANAPYSAILGGINNNIESGNTMATIIGGYGISLTGTDYAYTTVVNKFAIFDTPLGTSAMTYLVKDNATGIVHEVPQVTPVNITASRGLTKVGNDIRLGGTTSGSTQVQITSSGQLQLCHSATGGGNLAVNQFGIDIQGGNAICTMSSNFNAGGLTLSANHTGIDTQTSLNVGGFGGTVDLGSSDTNDFTSTILSLGKTGIYVNSTFSGFTGVEYGADYSANFVDRSLVDKAYVDAVAQGLDPKESVRVATTTALTGATYVSSGGTTGTGQFTSAPTVVDGITLADGNRILVKNQADPRQNGIYVRISASVWDRSADQDGTPSAEVSSGNFTFVETGSTLTATGWVVGGDGILTINTDPINWIQFSAANSYLAGDGIEIIGNTISVDLATNSGLDFSGGDLTVASTIAGSGLDLTAGVLSVKAANGLSVLGDNVVLGGLLTGNTTINSNNAFGLAIGCNASATGANSFAQGYNTTASGADSIAMGQGSESLGNKTTAIGYYSYSGPDSAYGVVMHGAAYGVNQFVFGGTACSGATWGIAVGRGTRATLACSVGVGPFARSYSTQATAIGNTVCASGNTSFAAGTFTRTCATGAIAIGTGANTRFVTAQGTCSLNISFNNGSQTLGHGALANNSAIIGGINSNIATGNTRAVLIGGNAIKLTGSTYAEHTVVDNFAIMTAPSAGVTGDTVLVRSATTGKIRSVSQASIAAGAAATTANNGLTKSGNNIHLGGELTGDTCIGNAGGFGFAIGDGAVATATQSFAFGYGATASGEKSFALGYNAQAAGYQSFAFGYDSCSCGDYSIAMGSAAYACGFNSHAINGACACGDGSFAAAYGVAHGNGAISLGGTACGDNSVAEGGSFAFGELSHSEGLISCAWGNYSHAQGCATCAAGIASHSAGSGYGLCYINANGHSSFNHSRNHTGQTEGHGALANQSAILGGMNHNIASGNTNAAIVGGIGIKLTGTTYINTTAVANLAIMSTPAAGTTGDTILVRDAVTGKIKGVSQSAINPALTMTIVTGNTTLTNSTDVALVITSASTITVTLPASPTNGKKVYIKDVSGNANSNNVTVSGNGNNVDGAAATLISTDGGSVGLIYNSILDSWFIIAFVN